MLRDGRTFYAVLFKTEEDILRMPALSKLFPAELVQWDDATSTKRCADGTIVARHGIYLSEKQYSSDPNFLEHGYDKKRRAYRYNFYILRYSSPKDTAPLYILASPFKRLAARIFRHLTTVEQLEYTYQRVKLAKLLAGVDELVTASPRLSVPMVDFYVYGDGGSEDVKISGSDPMKSKVYRALNSLTQARSASDRIDIAPCSVILALDFQSEEPTTIEIYFKGILSCPWKKDLSHLNDLAVALNALQKRGLIEETSVRPNWMTESRAKALLGTIPEYDHE